MQAIEPGSVRPRLNRPSEKAEIADAGARLAETWRPATPFGEAFIVNGEVAGEQGAVLTLGLPDGRSLVTWLTYDDTGRIGVRVARFVDADGAPIGPDRTMPVPQQASLVALPDGRVIATWTDGRRDSPANARIFDANLDPIGAPFRVDDIVGENLEIGPAIALADGGFLIAWSESTNDGDEDLRQVYFRRYDAEGSPIGASVTVGHRDEFERFPEVTPLANGELLLTWNARIVEGGDGFARLFGAAGNSLGERTQVTINPGGHSDDENDVLEALALNDGGHAILWYRDIANGELRISRYDEAGALIYSVRAVDPGVFDEVFDGRFVKLDDGGFVVVWTTDEGLFARALTEGGALAGGVFQITDQVMGRPSTLYDIDARGDGSYLVTWSAPGLDGADIFAREILFEIGTLAINDMITIREDQTENVVVLGNDADATDDPLSVVSISDPAHGSVMLNPDGTISYTPDPGFFGTDRFHYTISDGFGGTDNAKVTVNVEYVDDADTFNGGAGNDRLDGGIDNDRVNGFGGDDTLIGGIGNDRAYGGDGHDFASGGTGKDTLVGNEGDDELDGESGKDRLRGDDGADLLRGGSDDDELFGGAGDDRLIGGSGTDVLLGEDGEDRLEGGLDKDVIDGGADDDLIIGGASRDTMTGGAGADRFRFDAPEDFSGEGQFADRITDFSQAEGDRIDLRKLDAVAGGLDSEFLFIGDAAFSREAGELRFEQDGSRTYVEGDIDGDGAADFTIRLESAVALMAADFLL